MPDVKIQRYIKKHGMKYCRFLRGPLHLDVLRISEALKEGVPVSYGWDSDVVVIIPKECKLHAYI